MAGSCWVLASHLQLPWTLLESLHLSDCVYCVKIDRPYTAQRTPTKKWHKHHVSSTKMAPISGTKLYRAHPCSECSTPHAYICLRQMDLTKLTNKDGTSSATPCCRNQQGVAGRSTSCVFSILLEKNMQHTCITSLVKNYDAPNVPISSWFCRCFMVAFWWKQHFRIQYCWVPKKVAPMIWWPQ